MNDQCDNNIRKAPANSELTYRRRLLIAFIGLCCIGFFITDVVTPIYFNDFVWAMLLLGVVTAQLTVICVWGTLVRGTFLMRLPWTILLLVISWSGFSLGINIKQDGYDADAKLGVAVMWVIGFITSFVPLEIAALGFGWQIVQASNFDPIRRDDSRYTIADLILGTMLIAISLGMIRVFLRIEGVGVLQALRNRFLSDAKGWIAIAVYGVISLLIKLPCIWISLGQKSQKIPSWIVLWVFYCLFLAIIEIVAFTLAFGPPPSNSVREFAALIIGHQIMGAVILFVCLALRGLGYRLERSLRKPSEPQSEPVIEPTPSPLNAASVDLP